MPILVGQSQVSLVAGRSIINNSIIVQEIIHSMRIRKGWMTIKVHLEKVYDRVRWDFLNDTLRDAGFPRHLITLIMHSVSTCTMQILWNGPMDEIVPSRDSSQASSIMAILDQFAYFSPLFFASYEYFQSELHWAIFRSAAFSQTDNYKYLQFLG
ncbi:uncharacterized protein [Gossypium hirsutum]|uniref:Reverse transcriptase domain-containing protein n=1 Tax=Gossypium hirsutum TaxID=3635 RepID=A0A1U8KBM3_GOSHI|nr:uncharacterized protein LOC107915242 [Gossypium hirsutum]